MMKRREIFVKRMAIFVLAVFVVLSMMPAQFAEASDSPKNDWITFPQDTGVECVATADDADHFRISKPIEFNDNDQIIINYQVGGQQWYRCALLRDEDGNLLVKDSGDQEDTLRGDGGIVLKDSMTRNRTVTLEGLEEHTTYQLYWGKGSANSGRNPQCDVILTFTTGTLTFDYDFSNETGDRDGRGFAWKNETKTLTIDGVDDANAAIILPAGATLMLEDYKKSNVTSITCKGDLTVDGGGELTVGEIAKVEKAIRVSGNLVMENGIVNAIGTVKGIDAEGDVTIMGGHIQAEGSQAALSAAGHINMDGMQITSPEGATNESGNIKDSEGKPATQVTIAKAGLLYKVNFDTSGGSQVGTQMVEPGKKASRPTDPTWLGYVFKEWLLDGVPYDFDTPITEDITLTARWQLAGPMQGWITFAVPAAKYAYSDIVEDVETDFYVIDEPVEFTQDGKIVITYQTGGQQNHEVIGLQLRDENGAESAEGTLTQSTGNTRDVTLENLRGETKYQVYWPQKSVKERNPQRAVVLSFETAVLNKEQLVLSPLQNAPYTGQEYKPEPKVTFDDQVLKKDTDYQVEYEGDTVNAGRVTVKVTGIGGYEGKEAVGSYYITRIPLSDDDVELPEGDGRDDQGTMLYKYTGHAIKPEPKVTYGEKVLIEGKDYLKSYWSSDDPWTNVHDSERMRVTITGIGNYTGESIQWYKIVPLDISGAEVSGIKEETYTGEEIKPNPILKMNDLTLKENVDFTVKYADNIDIGTATMTISGTGNYEGQLIKTFRIVKQAEMEQGSNSNENSNTNSSDTNGGSQANANTNATNPANQKGADGTALGKGASSVAAEKAITGMKSDGDPSGARFAPLMLRSAKQTKTSEKVTWKKVSGAKKYVLYGNKCGKAFKMKKIATTNTNSVNVKKVAGKKLKKKTYYKYIVVALDANDNVVSTSKVIHVATKGSKKAGNHKSVKVSKPKKAKVTVKKGKTTKIKAKAVAAKKTKVKKHRVLSYESANTSIATVSKKGVIKGVKKGKTKIYAYAQNGIAKAITVTVK